MICPNCGAVMRAEHAHHRCDHCGWITTCCEGAPLTERRSGELDSGAPLPRPGGDR